PSSWAVMRSNHSTCAPNGRSPVRGMSSSRTRTVSTSCLGMMFELRSLIGTLSSQKRTPPSGGAKRLWLYGLPPDDVPHDHRDVQRPDEQRPPQSADTLPSKRHRNAVSHYHHSEHHVKRQHEHESHCQVGEYPLHRTSITAFLYKAGETVDQSSFTTLGGSDGLLYSLASRIPSGISLLTNRASQDKAPFPRRHPNPKSGGLRIPSSGTAKSISWSACAAQTP